MSRFSIFLMSLFSVAVVLAGCGGPESQADPDPSDNPCAADNPCATAEEDDTPSPAVAKEREPDLMSQAQDAPDDTAAADDPDSQEEASPDSGTTESPAEAEDGTVATEKGTETPEKVKAEEPEKERPRWAGGSASKGEALYKKCKGCHGTVDKPGKLGPDLFSHNWSRSEKKEAFETIENGKGKMPAFGDKLDDGEIADLIAYVSD